MGLQIQLNAELKEQFASSILLSDIKAFIDSHQKEYEKFLNEKKQQNTKEQNFNSNNSIWNFYPDDTICNVKVDNK